ncbi:MAG: hypothetical protein ACLS8R_01235 [Anaeromassilibacillus sp.]
MYRAWHASTKYSGQNCSSTCRRADRGIDILIDNITRISEAVKQRDADALRGLLRQGRLIKERLGE